MKTLVTTIGVALLLSASACTSTVTIGPKANQATCLSATAGTKGVSVTLPLVKAEVAVDATAKAAAPPAATTKK